MVRLSRRLPAPCCALWPRALLGTVQRLKPEASPAPSWARQRSSPATPLSVEKLRQREMMDYLATWAGSWLPSVGHSPYILDDPRAGERNSGYLPLQRGRAPSRASGERVCVCAERRGSGYVPLVKEGGAGLGWGCPGLGEGPRLRQPSQPPVSSARAQPEPPALCSPLAHQLSLDHSLPFSLPSSRRPWRRWGSGEEEWPGPGRMRLYRGGRTRLSLPTV